MDQIQQYAKTYQEYKAELDTELSKTAEGFVRIGYLLKVARDTDVLSQSPYQTVTEFAKAEYGIDKTMVSRFISINDRFSEGGYSDQLLEQYRGYGYAKLTLMLSLPDEINQVLSPAYSKAEIQAIKDEVDEEKNISDLEVMMEPAPEQSSGGSLLDMLVRQLGEDSPELYVQMAALVNLDNHMEWTRKAKEAMAPDGEKQYSIRVSGRGRYLMSIRETENTITITALRTLEKETHAYHTLKKAWAEILPMTAGTEKENQESWETTYNREYPGKARVAPVQHSAKPGKTESKPIPRKESKVQKAPKPKPTKKEPDQEIDFPAPEPEKPESTGTEPASDEIGREQLKAEQTTPETEREPKEAEQPAQEAEKPQKTGEEGVSESEIEFVSGMRIRNKVGNPHFPTTPGTILGRHWSVPAWNVRFDRIDMTKLIYDTDMEEFEIIKEEPYGESGPAGDQTPDNQEEQLPGQIGLEEAIEEADERAAEKALREIHMAAGQEPGRAVWDQEWEQETDHLLNSLESMMGIPLPRLSILEPPLLKEIRKYAINVAALVEKELLRRGEEF